MAGQLAPRFVEADGIDQRGLTGVLAGVLAGDGAVVAGHVLEVVAQLEGVAGGQRKGAQRGRHLVVGLGDDGGHVDRDAQQHPGFQFVGGGDVVDRGALAVQVEELALDQTLRADGLGQLADQARAHRGRDVRRRRQDAEGTAEQGDGGQDGDVLAELHVHGRLAAAQLGVVHAGHVVQNQRGRVHQLDRAGDVDQRRRGAAEVTRDQHGQQRAHALAAAESAGAHGCAQLVVARTAFGEPVGDALLDGFAHGAQLGRRIDPCFHGKAIEGLERFDAIESIVPPCLCAHCIPAALNNRNDEFSE